MSRLTYTHRRSRVDPVLFPAPPPLLVGNLLRHFSYSLSPGRCVFYRPPVRRLLVHLLALDLDVAVIRLLGASRGGCGEKEEKKRQKIF